MAEKPRPWVLEPDERLWDNTISSHDEYLMRTDCGLAHGWMEKLLHPKLYRTKWCSHKLECQIRPCCFAHYEDELRVVINNNNDDNNIQSVQEEPAAASSLVSFEMAKEPRPWVLERDKRLWDNTISSYDEYMMRKYKVYECSNYKATDDQTHSWADCHFKHLGDFYGRRDPMSVPYNEPIKYCNKYNTGKNQYCRPDCVFAHGLMEKLLHAQFYRTKWCTHKPKCRNKPCCFAHYEDELRVVNDNNNNDNGVQEEPAATQPVLFTTESGLCT